MTNLLSELHLLLARTSQEYRRGLHGIIGAPPGDSAAALCGHLSLLRANAGPVGDGTDYKQLVTDVADRVRLDWAVIVGSTSWSDLPSEQIEAAIVRHVEADKMYREEAPSPSPDVIAALDDAFSSLPAEWRKLLAAVIYIHQIIRPSTQAVGTPAEPKVESTPAAARRNNGGNGAEPAPKDLRSLQASGKSGAEPFRARSRNLGPTLLDFWRWSASDLAADSTRAALAAYLVARALGTSADLPAKDGGAASLLYSGGLKIAVTSGVYLASQGQEKAADVRFPIRNEGEAGVGVVAVNLRKRADVYVFCLLPFREQEAVDPLDVAQWEFYVVPSSVLDTQFPLGRSVRLQSLLELNVSPIEYDQLAGSIEGMGTPTAERFPASAWRVS